MHHFSRLVSRCLVSGGGPGPHCAVQVKAAEELVELLFLVGAMPGESLSWRSVLQFSNCRPAPLQVCPGLAVPLPVLGMVSSVVVFQKELN